MNQRKLRQKWFREAADRHAFQVMSAIVIRAVKQQVWNEHIAQPTARTVWEKTCWSGGISSAQGQIFQKSQTLIFLLFFLFFSPHLSVLLNRMVGCKNGSPSHSLQNHKGKIATSFLPPTQIWLAYACVIVISLKYTLFIQTVLKTSDHSHSRLLQGVME